MYVSVFSIPYVAPTEVKLRAQTSPVQLYRLRVPQRAILKISEVIIFTELKNLFPFPSVFLLFTDFRLSEVRDLM